MRVGEAHRNTPRPPLFAREPGFLLSITALALLGEVSTVSNGRQLLLPPPSVALVDEKLTKTFLPLEESLLRNRKRPLARSADVVTTDDRSQVKVTTLPELLPGMVVDASTVDPTRYWTVNVPVQSLSGR